MLLTSEAGSPELLRKNQVASALRGGADLKQWVYAASLTVLLLCLTPFTWVFFSSLSVIEQHAGPVSATTLATPLPSNRPFDYILIILMENKNFKQINGSSSAPYLNQLAYNYSLATQYSACDHPSLPTYMCLTV